MAFRYLPVFEPGIRVQGDRARQDRILLDVGTWDIELDTSEYQIVVEHLGTRAFSGPLGPSPVFNRAQVRGPTSSYKFSNAAGRQVGGPLVSGRLVDRWISGGEFRLDRRRIHFELAANPTRWINSQPHHPQIRAREEVSHYPESELLRSRPFPDTPTETVLDAAENVILNRMTHLMAIPPHWAEYRRIYLRSLDAYANSLVAEAYQANMTVGMCNRSGTYYNLKLVENYWEFQSTDAIRDVYTCIPSFQSLGIDSRFRLYENLISEAAFSGHSPVLSCRISTGVRIRLYAKTTRRVRIEVEHDLRKWVPQGTSHTFASLHGVNRQIDHTSADAARQVNSVLDAIVFPQSVSTEEAPPYELVWKVAEAASSRIHGERLLSILVNGNGIRLRPNDNLRGPVLRLVKAGVLQRLRPRAASFQLTSRYRKAQQILADASGASWLL